MGGRILSLHEACGPRPVLIVKDILRLPQLDARRCSTVFSGEQVLLPFTGAIGTATPENYQFNQWFANLTGQPLPWSQGRALTAENLEILTQQWPKLPIAPVKTATLTLMAAGNDPIHGYWLQFEGDVALFDQPDWWVENDDELFDYEQSFDEE